MNPSTICGLFYNDPDPSYLREVTVGSPLTKNKSTFSDYHYLHDSDVSDRVYSYGGASFENPGMSGIFHGMNTLNNTLAWGSGANTGSRLSKN